MSDLDCSEVVALVTAFMDGALDPETERSVIDHLRSCGGCSAHLEQVKATITRLGQIEPGPLSAQTRSNLLAAFRNPS